jgi:hypothetical protein
MRVSPRNVGINLALRPNRLVGQCASTATAVAIKIGEAISKSFVYLSSNAFLGKQINANSLLSLKP